MYEFVDTTAAPDRGSRLPAEAVKFNGLWLDEEVAGFRTLNISGRELMECEVTDEQMGSADGTRYQYRRYPPRTITVTYQLAAESNRAFRDAFNRLNALLSAEQAELLFHDEEDKFFIATKAGCSEVPAGMNHVTGEIYFYCTDPLKYSAAEKTFSAGLNEDGVLEVTIINEGTEPVPVSYEVMHNHENGYIGIVSEHGVMQYGRVDEADGENYERNERQARITDFSLLEDDNGINYMCPTYSTAGKLVTEKIGGRTCLHLRSIGTAVSGKWNGGLKTWVLPADSEGNYGAKNFYCYLNHWFETGLMGQTGEQSIAFLTEDNKVICGYRIYKTDMTGNTAYMDYWANGKRIKRIKFTPSFSDADNPFNNGRGHNDIRKEGDKLTFYWWGNYPCYTIPGIKDMECYKIQVAFTQYAARGLAAKYVTRNYLREIDFWKQHVEKWRDVPNRYPEGSTVYIDGGAAKVYVNGMANMGDEVAGTKYFHAPPGETKVEFYYSSFCNPPPTVIAKIREAYR